MSTVSAFISNSAKATVLPNSKASYSSTNRCLQFGLNNVVCLKTFSLIPVECFCNLIIVKMKLMTSFGNITFHSPSFAIMIKSCSDRSNGCTNVINKVLFIIMRKNSYICQSCETVTSFWGTQLSDATENVAIHHRLSSIWYIVKLYTGVVGLKISPKWLWYMILKLLLFAWR